MAENPPGGSPATLDAFRTRLQAEIDAQFRSLAESHDAALVSARRDAQAEAERTLAARLDEARAEMAARIEGAVSHARSEASQQAAGEIERARLEWEDQAAEAERLRRDDEERSARKHSVLETQLLAERARAAHAERQAEALRDEHLRATAALDARRAEPVPTLDLAALVDDVRSIDGGRSLTDTLAATAQAAVRHASRAALFLCSGSHLQEWSVAGVPALSSGEVPAAGPDAGLFEDVLSRHEAVATNVDGTGPAAPWVALLPGGRSALAAPLVIEGQSVAILYADDVGQSERPSWRDAIQLLALHASSRLACITALRTLQATRMDGTLPAPPSAADDDTAARRYARLLISEVRLYNESAVRLGRENRDLLHRLGPEIERARRLYDERVPESMTQRDIYFRQELLQTLADGNAALLG